MKKKIILLLMCCMMCIAITACSGSDNPVDDAGNAVEDAADGAGDAVKDVTDGVGDAVKDVTDGAGDAVKDVADGAGDAVNDAAHGVGDAADNIANGAGDMINGSVRTFDDAYNRFMGMLPDSSGCYSITNNDKDLVEYADGKRGYHIELHDSKNGDKKVGDFYVDPDTGKIYKLGSDKKAVEYDFSDLK